MNTRLYEGQYSAFVIHGTALALAKLGHLVTSTLDYNRFGKKVAHVTGRDEDLAILDAVYEEIREIIPQTL